MNLQLLIRFLDFYFYLISVWWNRLISIMLNIWLTSPNVNIQLNRFRHHWFRRNYPCTLHRMHNLSNNRRNFLSWRYFFEPKLINWWNGLLNLFFFMLFKLLLQFDFHNLRHSINLIKIFVRNNIQWFGDVLLIDIGFMWIINNNFIQILMWFFFYWFNSLLINNPKYLFNILSHF